VVNAAPDGVGCRVVVQGRQVAVAIIRATTVERCRHCLSIPSPSQSPSATVAVSAASARALGLYENCLLGIRVLRLALEINSVVAAAALSESLAPVCGCGCMASC